MIGQGWIVGLLIVVLGCQDEGVRVLHVTKPPTRRTLAVIIPRSDATWFIKLNGPADAVAADAAAFREFGGSVQFTDGKPPIRYTLPQGWRADGSGPTKGGIVDRFASFRTQNDSEVLVTRLGAEANSVLLNVNRWRGEVGLNPVTASDLDQIVEPVEIGGAKSTFVNVNELPNTPATPIRETTPEHPKELDTTSKIAAEAHQPKAVFPAPSHWQPLPASGIRVAAWRVGEGNDAAEVTIIPLTGTWGNVPKNINRWRVELGLESLPDETITASLTKIEVEGKSCPYADLLGPISDKQQRTLGIIVDRDATAWFIKMRGHPDTVGKQQAAFESFVRSIKLPEGR
jgi:hypothetical protein